MRATKPEKIETLKSVLDLLRKNSDSAESTKGPEEYNKKPSDRYSCRRNSKRINALAQMKLEVESLGRDYGDNRLRKSPIKHAIAHMSPLPGFSLRMCRNSKKRMNFSRSVYW
ncbi:hypothetical protein K1719_020214 [Acacia pycnantha]|nr:hypothetical protein K1719_020214 [Acacia pycnantha]